MNTIPPATQPRPSLSVVAPCYNEALCLEQFHARMRQSLLDCGMEDYELILVNDGSRDATWEVIVSLSSRDPRVVGVDLSRNHGHQLAVTAGLAVCRGEKVLLIDADLQDPPELLGRMLEIMREKGADVVYGQRESRKGETWAKKAEAKAFYRFLNAMTDIPIPLDTGDFRLMTRRVVEVLRSMPESHRFIRGMVSWVGFTQAPMLYHRDERFAGETKYTLRKMIAFATDAITGFSIRPLRFASYMGVAFSALGFALLLYVLASLLWGYVVPGWASILGIMLVLMSCQLLVLGMAGEYIGRIYMQVKGRPLFIVRRVTGPADLAEAARASAAPWTVSCLECAGPTDSTPR